MKTKVILLAFALLASFGITAHAQYKLSIRVKGIETESGSIMLALYNNSETFLIEPFKTKSVPAIGTSQIIELNDLQSGSYAAAIFHDENGNGDLDRGEYGIPLEKFGFSNNVIPKMGPPSFEECKIDVVSDTQTEIRLISAYSAFKKISFRSLVNRPF
ncbi:DUF2141 domain-containing protein [Porphyromonas canoris]|uniref:DUF2141 domain-containing protein n=1 Tax=Porphyromonas canoris TaxID=36875 RepID=UPI00068CEE78|nr:DUF2141 domain-containing protein [Porphyromonas canoris]